MQQQQQVLRLGAMPAQEQRSELGEALFPLVAAKVGGRRAGKVTGMLINANDVGAILLMLTEPALLDAAIARVGEKLEEAAAERSTAERAAVGD